jgi:DNA-directed RNA polymerase subunit N (RpoN/RPB10)
MSDWAAADRYLQAQERGELPVRRLACGCVIGAPQEQFCERARGYLAEARTAHEALGRCFSRTLLDRLNDAFERLREHQEETRDET